MNKIKTEGIEKGKRWGKWTVVGEPVRQPRKLRADGTGGFETYVPCLCECGTERLVRANLVRSMASQSCGCETPQILREKNTTHGKSKTIEYHIWQSMMNRCHFPSNIGYASYGGRGIIVCERWHTFENFWLDMCPRPFPEAEIDRIDNDGNYEPSNCRWATPEQNANNKRSNRVVEFAGKSQTVAEWARESGVEYSTLLRRLKKWPVERALTAPLSDPHLKDSPRWRQASHRKLRGYEVTE